MHARGRFTAVPPLNAGVTTSRLLPADPRPPARTQQVLTIAPYSPPRREPAERLQPAARPRPRKRRAAPSREPSASPQRTTRLTHQCRARRPGAAWGEPIESCHSNGGGGEGGEDVLAQKQYSAGMSVAAHLRTKGLLSASAISPVPDLPIPDKNKKSAAPLVPGARTEFEEAMASPWEVSLLPRDRDRKVKWCKEGTTLVEHEGANKDSGTNLVSTRRCIAPKSGFVHKVNVLEHDEIAPSSLFLGLRHPTSLFRLDADQKSASIRTWSKTVEVPHVGAVWTGSALEIGPPSGIVGQLGCLFLWMVALAEILG
ncbi:hypothetical protein EDB85DRAFT_1898397 [Lactarius pseudohatsudake]|nr:hypothetical protein EDB85DRAFT_1898397 [Lactarius pseudohatsudake]